MTIYPFAPFAPVAPVAPVARSERRRNRELGDGALVAVVLVLSLMGLMMIFSASSVRALRDYQDAAYFLKKQACWMLIGWVFFALAARMDYHRLREKMLPLAGLVLLLLVWVLMDGTKVNGARRWLRIGPAQFQPSELAKLFLVIYLSHYMTRKEGPVSILPPLMIVAAVAGLTLSGRDLGSALMMLALAWTLFLLGGTPPMQLLALATAAVPLAIYWMIKTPWRLERLLGYLNPWENRLTSGHQLIQSYLALGSGGSVGVGLGEGRQKLFFLPESHTDFVFAVVGEELGLLGTLLVTALYAALLWLGTRIALSQSDPFGRMLAFGMTWMMTLSVLVNMAVVTGLMPTKGLPLPFMSYGGSSLVVNFLAAGLLYRLSKDPAGGERRDGITDRKTR